MSCVAYRIPICNRQKKEKSKPPFQVDYFSQVSSNCNKK
ncbi:hypothetical protein ECW26_18130 [Escherichia coli W26]|nr:hypothetical protein ECW26_18130 [Escherichia coli W26]